ncbi:MAG: hypothetical protein GY855_10255, partial [candidate division Zixibacteria bacterium]|nr:hypothetical protein [candidate division Zixibacteria bacterium]
QKTYILIILILFSLSSSTEASTITSINVNRNDVFDSELKDHDFFIYRWGNAIHFKTRESVIRDELLYKTGDILDTLKIIESERNLRSLEFMGDVTTSLTYNTDSTEIAIDLTTSDQWTTVAGLTSEGSGGEYTYGVVLSEVNLLGWGKEVQAEYYTGNDRRGHYLYYNDPNFMRSHHYAFIDWENNGFIRFTSYGLRKPFYSLEDKQAYSINGYDSKGKIRYYYDGYELFRYDSDVSDYQATLTRSYGRDFKRNYSLSINWRKEEYSLSQNANKYRVLVPPDLIETRLNLNMLFGFYHYSTVKYLDNFGNTEDLTLGLWVEFSAGRSFDILDGNILRNFGNATIKTSFRISNNLFVSAETGISGRYINKDYEHMRYSQRLSLYLKNSHRMISAFRILGRFYDRPDRFTVNYIG